MEKFESNDSRFSDDSIRTALGEKETEAKRILEDKDATNATLNKAQILLDKIKKLPVIGGLVDDISTMIAMIKDYVGGCYPHVPFRIILAAMAAILYLISPVDLIPDWIPFVGYLDDAAVIIFVLHHGMDSELKKYINFKYSESIHALWAPIYKNMLDESKGCDLLGVFLTDEPILKLLLVPCDQEIVFPQDVTASVVPFPYQEFESLAQEMNATVASIVHDVVNESPQLASHLVTHVCQESAFTEFDTYFNVVEEF